MNLELWKKIKKEKKLTIEQIAKAANLPKGSVQNIFCGYVPNPRSDTVEAIERALGINEKSSPAEQESMKVPDSLKPYQFAFYEGLDGLSDESMKDILKYIEFRKSQEKPEKK